MRKSASYTVSFLSLLMAYPMVHAGTEGKKLTYPEGWALSAGLGETEFLNQGVYNTAAGGMQTDATTRSFQFGVMGDIAAGYGKQLTSLLFLGSELGLNVFGTRKTSSSYSAKDSTTVVDVYNAFGVDITQSATINDTLSTHVTVASNVFVPFFDIKPGLLVTPNTFMYGRLGVNYNQIKITTQSSTYLTGAVPVPGVGMQITSVYSTLSGSQKKQLIGLRTGLGFEYLISENVGLSANYVYAFYNTVHNRTVGHSNEMSCDVYEGCTSDANGNYSVSGRSKMSDQQAILQIVYHLT